ncbi:MAG: acyltransferase family protein [Caulobacteraceae bacterium]
MTMPPVSRLPALDIVRGAAVAGMLLVTMPGDWSFTFAELRHADWNGWTLADMVFPAFLFSAGMALGLAFPRATADSDARSRAWIRVGRRALALVLLGLLLEATYNLAISAGAQFPGKGGLENLRLPGVLQRIGVCYGLAAALLFGTAQAEPGGGRRVNVVAIGLASGAILLGYWLILALTPVPGFGVGRLDAAGSLPAYVDRTVFTPAHMWPLATAVPGGPVTYDPEGLLSTFPATVNVLLGVLAAEAWRRRPSRAVGMTAAAGLLLVAAGLALDRVFPINKRLWTSSFALFSGGVATLSLAGAAVLMRSSLAVRVMTPLNILGANAVLAFALATGLSRISGFAVLKEAGAPVTPQTWGYHAMLRLIPEPYLASFACAVGMLALITLAIWPLHRRGIHLRL